MHIINALYVILVKHWLLDLFVISLMPICNIARFASQMLRNLHWLHELMEAIIYYSSKKL